MSSFTDLLGLRLMSGSSEADTIDLLSGKSAVALYFSAHWCPPCRGFTPKLVDSYLKHLKERGLEVVFVSSDKEQASFDSYFADMPWLALPYGDRARKEALCAKFEVPGIPILVVLDSEGKMITKDGRGAVTSDPEGADFPWTPQSFHDVMEGAKLFGAAGKELDFQELAGKTVGLYFSAHWCPPCREFTPRLADSFLKCLKQKGLEIVFVSSDRDEAAFKDYFAEMPWLALDYSDEKRRRRLTRLFAGKGIPCLVIVSAEGVVATLDGRASVTRDPEGESFPWHQVAGSEQKQASCSWGDSIRKRMAERKATAGDNKKQMNSRDQAPLMAGSINFAGLGGLKFKRPPAEEKLSSTSASTENRPKQAECKTM